MVILCSLASAAAGDALPNERILHDVHAAREPIVSSGRPRNVQLQTTANWLNIQSWSWGAIRDGQADETEAIQNAFDYMSATRGVVHIGKHDRNPTDYFNTATVAVYIYMGLTIVKNAGQCAAESGQFRQMQVRRLLIGPTHL